MTKRKILIIDDTPENVEIMEGYLRIGVNSDHDVLKASNGKAGFELLEQLYEAIDLILLDRMMPIMSGVDFLKKVKAHNLYKRIPIIMQTASSEKEHLLEGFELGVYHYLVKPYSPTIFNSIVRTAIELYSKQREQYIELKENKNLLKFVDVAVFKIKSLDDVDQISVSLARLFPNPKKVILGISEILTNAVEHGNLNITYEEKTHLNMTCKWKEEVSERLTRPENQEKYVWISYIKRDNEIILNIKDEGVGFNYHPFLDFDPERSTDNHGRGIAFANNLCFDKLEYLGKGNEVNCVVFTR